MISVALVGGGLAGLALAHSLHARRVDWALFEARPRLGGRVLTAQPAGGPPLDLGPTWFWPDTQPSIARLVADLGLEAMPQADDGRVWLLDDPNAPPQARVFDAQRGQLLADVDAPARPGALHGGAQRLVGGMAGLIDALAAALPAARVHLDHALQALHDHGDHVELHVAGRIVQARRVVLLLPPRLVAERVHFQPALETDLIDHLRAVPTWMATAAKAAVPCDAAPWRTRPALGNAWVTHAQATLAEVFDAGTERQPALAGFVALGPDQRGPFARALPLLVQSQIGMLFGADAAPGDVQLLDWAAEPFTCSEADRTEGATPHPHYGDPLLQQPHWNGRLWFGGSETARQGGGYLEGALSSAARLRRQLADASPAAA